MTAESSPGGIDPVKPIPRRYGPLLDSAISTVGVAQLVELLVVVQAVVGSSPIAHPEQLLQILRSAASLKNNALREKPGSTKRLLTRARTRRGSPSGFLSLALPKFRNSVMDAWLMTVPKRLLRAVQAVGCVEQP